MPGGFSSAVTPTCSYWISWPQNPPMQRSEQHWAFMVHADPTAEQADPSPWQEPLMHTLLQQSAPVVQAPLVAVQGIVHTPLVHTP